MRLLRCLVFVLIFGSLGFADTIAVTPGTGGAENDLYNYNGTLGWQYTLSSPVAVTALGYFDANGSAGLSDSYPVGIWNSAGTQLVSATVPSGAPSSLVDGFSFISVVPIVLGAGTYDIGAYATTSSTDQFKFLLSGSATVTGLTLGDGLTVVSSSLTDPVGGTAIAPHRVISDLTSWYLRLNPVAWRSSVLGWPEFSSDGENPLLRSSDELRSALRVTGKKIRTGTFGRAETRVPDVAVLPSVVRSS